MVLAAAAPGGALAADIPGGAGTGAVARPGEPIAGAFERRGDSDWYKVALKGGVTYAVTAGANPDRNCGTRVSLRTRAGKVLKSANSFEAGDGGFEFRPATARTLFVEFLDLCRTESYPGPYPVRYAGAVTRDARGDAETLATVAPGQTIDGVLNWGTDVDYFRATLDGRKGYTFSATGGGEFQVSLVDAGGRVVFTEYAPSGTFRGGTRVPASGTYYVVVRGTDDDGMRYTLGLATP